ncbi:hypothetical protein CHR90_06680 [Elstera cyanobacteriorum]|uniref:Uncharacterized protein n=1 Tax=Elstera cyanobacteriorum TaxID=2022747 RepID=A0A255XU80_9PROT|nr:hypothetical protein CHR90_06680 [Elstera cyanobacteriorum]
MQTDDSDTVASVEDVKDKALAEGKTTDDGLTFADLLDTINPLQHLPIIAPLYREITGDTISPAARIIGGGLFGGPLGLVASMVDAAIEDGTGRDIGGNLVAMVKGDPLGKDAMQNIAKAKTAEPKRPEVADASQAVPQPAAAPIAAAEIAQAPATAPAVPSIASGAPALPAEGGRIAVTGKGPMTAIGGAGAAMPAGATGFIGGKSSIPSGGMITPAAAMMAVQPQGQAQPGQAAAQPGLPGQPSGGDPTQSFSGLAGVAALQAQRSAPQTPPAAPPINPAAVAATTDADAPLDKGWFKLPERTGRSTTRAPVTLERREVNNTLATKPSTPNPTAVQAAEAANRQLPPASEQGQVLATGNPSISDAMARALNKYDALVKSRAGKPSLTVDEAY